MPGSPDEIARRRAATLADRLAASHRLRFVGRHEERALFSSTLDETGFPFALLHVHGPGGIGKSTLLRSFAEIADAHGVRPLLLDGRDLDPSPAGFLAVLGAVLQSPLADDPVAALAERRSVLLIDTFERLNPLDGWLRETFLPRLSEEVLVVFAGRQPLSAPWRLDPGWRDLVHSLGLRNFSPDEGHELLTQRGIPSEQQRDVLAYTHGHPLALALVADRLEALPRQGERFRFDDDPDVVRTLLERYLDEVADPLQREALEACALARVTTESLLAEVVGAEHAAACFAWLRARSFIEAGPRGLFPHDLVRGALDADLRWRHPERYQALHRQVRGYLTRRMLEARGREQQSLLVDDVYLHRHNPLVAPFLEWGAIGTVFGEAAGEADHPALLAMVEQHEGPAAAAVAAYWLERQPRAWTMLRDGGGEPVGLLATLRLEAETEPDGHPDPAVAAAFGFARRYAPPRPGETVVLFRFWMAHDTYQGVSSVQTAVFLFAVQTYFTTPNLSWSFFPCSDPDLWLPALHYSDITRAPEADFEVGGRHYATFAHDWRAVPVPAWLELLGDRELATGLKPEELAAARRQPLIVLAEPSFRDAVKDALHHYTRPAELARNPLLRSRLLAADGDDAEVETLRVLLREASETLQANPRDDKGYRALLHTYLEPAATQELAAELLNLPFSTYRRHLKLGIERVTELLWHRELEGAAD